MDGKATNADKPRRRRLLVLLLVFSLGANAVQGICSLVLQPLLMAEKVASEVATDMVSERSDHQREIARIKRNAEIEKRKAVELAVAKEKAKARAERQMALAAATALARQQKREAVSKAIAKEKSKARVGRIAVAVPVLGTGVAAGFEYADYKRWKEANPEKSFRVYADHSLQEINALAEEVMNSIPALVRINTDRIVTRYQIIIKKMGNLFED